MKSSIRFHIAAILIAFTTVALQSPAQIKSAEKRPNIVFILADDLGVGELGCYGQTKIHTPNIDRLASEGMRFTNAYSPSPVCAPSRCGILTGLHMGHAFIRDNKEVQPEGQIPIPQDTVTIAELLKQKGYATACIGKWGLGMVGSSGDPNKQGFDFFFGDNCQRVAHNHYPDHVWKNDARVELEGGGKDVIEGKHYVPDLMRDEAVKWIDGVKDHPFFLYFSTTLTHVSLQAPADALAEYTGKFEETPFVKKQGTYVSCDTPRATYAAMVTRLDQHVGAIVDQIKALGLEENTIIIFASDNGPTFRIGGADSAFFNSSMGLKGLKEEVYEGGIHVPLIARWPAHVKPGTSSDFVTVLYDLFPTLIQVAGAAEQKTDGVSLIPTLTGAGEQESHDYLYWEFGSHGGQRALRQGNWKAVQTGLRKDPNAPVELYDLATDPKESNDVAAKHPEIVEKLKNLMKSARTPAVIPAWNF